MRYEECEKKGDSHLGDDCHLGLTTFRLPHLCEMLQQQPVDEAIAPADLLEKDTVNGVIEETSVIGGSVSLNEEDKAQDVVLDHIEAAIP